MLTNLLQFKNSAMSLLSGIRSLIDTKLDKTANAVTATQLKDPFTLTIEGEVMGSGTLQGGADATLTVSLSDNGVTPGTFPKVVVDSTGRVTAGTSLQAADIPALPITKTTGLQTTLDSKLGTVDNAVSASKLQTARAISLTGDGSWTVPFSGETDVTAVFTLANSGVVAGTFGSVTQVPRITVDSKGRITGVELVTIESGTSDAIPLSQKGAPDGVAELNSAGQLPYHRIPHLMEYMGRTGGEVMGHLKAFGYLDSAQVIAASVANQFLNIGQYGVFDVTLATNTTFQLGTTMPEYFTPGSTSLSVVVRVRQGATTFTIAWTDTIVWLTPGGAVGTPPAAGKIKEFVLSTIDGTNWFGREGASNA